MKNFTHLSWQQIKDYLAGKMSAKEMHQIEAHLLDCELCSEAVDGFTDTNLSKDEIAIVQINRKLSKKLAKKVFQKIHFQKIAYWVGAASIVIISGIGLLFMKENQQKTATSTQQRLSESPQASPQEKPVLADLEQVDSQNTKQAQSFFEKDTKKELVEPKIHQNLKENTQNLAVVAENTQNDNFAANQEESIGEVQKDQARKKIAVQKESLEKPAINDKIEEQSGQKADIAEEAISEAQPLIGQKAYRLYLKENLHYPSNALKKRVGGEVIVEFEVMPDSSLANFEVIQKIDKDCDREALRLLKEGSLWKPAFKGKTPLQRKTRMSIFFELPKKLETEEY